MRPVHFWVFKCSTAELSHSCHHKVKYFEYKQWLQPHYKFIKLFSTQIPHLCTSACSVSVWETALFVSESSRSPSLSFLQDIDFSLWRTEGSKRTQRCSDEWLLFSRGMLVFASLFDEVTDKTLVWHRSKVMEPYRLTSQKHKKHTLLCSIGPGLQLPIKFCLKPRQPSYKL